MIFIMKMLAIIVRVTGLFVREISVSEFLTLFNNSCYIKHLKYNAAEMLDLLTYLCLFARWGMGHRQQHANGFGPGPVAQLGSNCSLPLGPFSKCFWVYSPFSFPWGSRSGLRVL